jgi:hypothetical protein
LERCQAYVTFCISAGVRIDVPYALRKLLDDIRSGYDNLESCEIKLGETTNAPFTNVLVTSSSELVSLDQIPMSVDWLSNILSSDLFLALWRQLGAKVLRESMGGAETLEGVATSEEEEEEYEYEDDISIPSNFIYARLSEREIQRVSGVEAATGERHDQRQRIHQVS